MEQALTLFGLVAALLVLAALVRWCGPFRRWLERVIDPPRKSTVVRLEDWLAEGNQRPWRI